jgi:hypothetical protein
MSEIFMFRPGTEVLSTGVYKAVHARQHAPAHYVIALSGETFPTCSECSTEVRFELAISATHVMSHPQFSR